MADKKNNDINLQPQAIEAEEAVLGAMMIDEDATNRARQYMLPYPPSSPSIALFKDGELVHFIERHNIEGHVKESIAENLTAAYDNFC